MSDNSALSEIEQGLKSVSGNSCLDLVIKDTLFKLTCLYVVHLSRYKYASVHAKLFAFLCISCYGPSVNQYRCPWVSADHYQWFFSWVVSFEIQLLRLKTLFMDENIWHWMPCFRCSDQWLVDRWNLEKVWAGVCVIESTILDKPGWFPAV